MPRMKCLSVLTLAGFVVSGAAGSLAGCAPAAPLDDARAWASAEENAWAGCPEPARAPVGDGALWLQAALDNVTCGLPDLAVEHVEDELARKAQLHLVAGDYFLPMEAGEHEFDLPLCVRKEAGVLASSTAEPGMLSVSSSMVLGRERLRLVYERPVRSPSGERFTFRLVLEGDARDLEPGVLVDGRPWPASGSSLRTYLCEGDACDPPADTSEGPRELHVFESCVRDDLPEELHRFEFEGGFAVVRVRAKGSFDEFQGAPVRATGELDGTPFDVEGYWDLVMRPTYWWDSARDFVLRFPSPIGTSCGLVVRNAYPYPDANWSTLVFTLDCAGERHERDVLSADWEPLTPEAE